MRIQTGISVVVPARVSERGDLLRLLESIDSEVVREVIVVDDASDEDIESWIYEETGDLTYRLFVHTNTENLGPSVSRNYGAQLSTSEHLLFADADVVFQSGCIDRLYQRAQGENEIVVQPMPETGHAESVDEQLDHNDLLTDPYRSLTHTGEIDYLYSFCFLISRTAFFSSRGFSALFTITHEDIEFGHRLLDQGVRIFCLKEARVSHHHAFDPDAYFRRCVDNGISFAKLADATGVRKYRQYVDLIQTHDFLKPIDETLADYQALRESGTYDPETYSDITKHFWIEGIRSYYASPVISVVVPVANQVERINQTLRSLKRQHFQNFEVHVVYTSDVDISSADWQGSQNIYFHRQEHGKLAHAMNIAREAAAGQLFTWVQCGDYVDRNYLRLLANEFFLDQSTSLSFCGYQFFGMTEQVDGWITKVADGANEATLINDFAQWNVVGPGFMVRLRNSVSYNEDNWLSEDWDFFLQNALKGRIRFVNSVLYFYFDHEDSLSRTVGWRAEDSSQLIRDQSIARTNFECSLAAQTVCAGYVIRNEDYFIRESILSVIDHVDEICIIDTGSTDSTLKIIDDIVASHPAAKKITVHHRRIFNYNVSRFRNEVAELTRCDWIMIVDGDEVWPESQISSFVDTMRLEIHYQTESLEVFQKRWANMLEQQTSFAYIGTLIRAYRRHHRFLWRQSETVDFFEGEKRYESRYLIDASRQQSIEAIESWLARLTTDIELQSVEYAYRNYDGQLSSRKATVEVYFDHFSRCKGELYLRDRVERIHAKLLDTTRFIERDRSWNQRSETFISLHQHGAIYDGLSIIIPHLNNVDGLNRCLQSIAEFEPGVPHEILIVHDDPTATPDKCDLPANLSVRVIQVAQRAGFGAAINTGMRAARYRYFCLCNDDVQFVAEGWGEKILSAMAADASIAVAGPLTNRTGGYPPLQYEEFGVAAFEDCARIAHEIADREPVEVNRHTVLSGFCYFLKRNAVVRAGLFDAAGYPWGYGEENAYTHRLLSMGYKAILVSGVFVWHDMGRTFERDDVNPEIDLVSVKRDNIRRVVGLSRPRLIAYGRAKDEAKIIEEQLRRMLGFCDRVVIHDTGSTDDTVAIARSFDRVTVLESTASVTYNAAIQLNTALQVARSHDPDWLLYFDMDQFYDSSIIEEVDQLVESQDTDIWSFRLYDGRFSDEDASRTGSTGFIYHTRHLCEPCYRVLPSLYRNSRDLMVAEPNDWAAWAGGNTDSGVSFPNEHCVLPIQYINPQWRGSFYDRRIASTIIRHLGNCIDIEDLKQKKRFYTEQVPVQGHVDDWLRYPLSLDESKLMRWHEKPGVEVDLGSHMIKYLRWDRDPAQRIEYVW